MYDKIIDPDFNNKSICDIHIYPIDYFYPIAWFNAQDLFKNNSVHKKQEFLDSFIIHFWNAVSQKYKPKAGDGSLFDYFSKLNCPFIYKMNSNT